MEEKIVKSEIVQVKLGLIDPPQIVVEDIEGEDAEELDKPQKKVSVYEQRKKSVYSKNMWQKSGTLTGEGRIIVDVHAPLIGDQRSAGTASKSQY